MIGYDRPNWGKSPYNEKQEILDMEYDEEIERLTELGIKELKKDGVCPDMKISFLGSFKEG